MRQLTPIKATSTIIVYSLLTIAQYSESLPIQDSPISLNSQKNISDKTTGRSGLIRLQPNRENPTNCGNKTNAHQNSTSLQDKVQSRGSNCQPPKEQIRSGSREISTRQGKVKKVDTIRELFREETENYPEDEIKNLLKQTSDELKELHNVLNTPLDPNVNLTERIAHHYIDDENLEGVREESVCRSAIRNIYPREATRDNVVVYVANTQEFMQVIQAEYCQDAEGECNYLRDNLPYGMQSVCVQKYAYKKLLYLDRLEKRMASDLFRYPSCCSCHVRLSLDLRSGLNNSIKVPITHRNSTTKLPIDMEERLVDPQQTSFSREPKLIDNSTILIGEKTEECTKVNCRGKAAALPSSNTGKVPGNDSHKVVGVNVGEDRIVRRVEQQPIRGNRSQSVSLTRKHSSTTNPTIVLHEDKVYTPSNS